MGCWVGLPPGLHPPGQGPRAGGAEPAGGTHLQEAPTPRRREPAGPYSGIANTLPAPGDGGVCDVGTSDGGGAITDPQPRSFKACAFRQCTGFFLFFLEAAS